MKSVLRCTPTSSAEGYAWFLHFTKDKDVVVFVAERAGAVVGYVYAGIEPASWKELREMAGVHPRRYRGRISQRTGIASSLIEAAMEWLRTNGAPRVGAVDSREESGSSTSVYAFSDSAER